MLAPGASAPRLSESSEARQVRAAVRPPAAALLCILAAGCSGGLLGGGGTNLAPNYLDSITRRLPWPSPSNLRVSIAQTNADTGALVPAETRDLVREGIEAWDKAIDGLGMSFISPGSAAQITVRFVGMSSGVFAGETVVTPDPTGQYAAACTVSVALPHPSNVRFTAVHHAGRALGMVEGTSPNGLDVMSSDRNLIGTPSARDINTLIALYAEKGIVLERAAR